MPPGPGPAGAYPMNYPPAGPNIPPGPVPSGAYPINYPPNMAAPMPVGGAMPMSPYAAPAMPPYNSPGYDAPPGRNPTGFAGPSYPAGAFANSPLPTTGAPTQDNRGPILQ